MKITRLLWFGPMQPESRMLGSTAPTPAAGRWSNGLLSALGQHGVEVVRVGHEPARVWPFGPMVSRAMPHFPVNGLLERPGIDHVREIPVSFLNVPGLRWKSLARSYDRAATAELSRGSVDVLVTYNADRSYMHAVERLGRQEVPWIAIVLDGDDSSAGWLNLAHRTQGAAGGVFLSHAACESSPFPSTFHLDGGIDVNLLPDGPELRRDKVVFYAGSRGPWAGVDLLLDAWELIDAPNAALWLCGQGESERLRRAVSTDRRIVDYGMVSESRLRDLMSKATVLINPRVPDHEGNTLNFPSKLLDYLGTGKPVISTWTTSLAPAYRDAIVVADPATPAVLAGRIEEVLAWEERQRSKHREAAMTFCHRHGNWHLVAGHFLSWLGVVADCTGNRSNGRSVS